MPSMLAVHNLSKSITNNSGNLNPPSEEWVGSTELNIQKALTKKKIIISILCKILHSLLNRTLIKLKTKMMSKF